MPPQSSHQIHQECPLPWAKSLTPLELQADADPRSNTAVFYLAKVREGNWTRLISVKIN